MRHFSLLPFFLLLLLLSSCTSTTAVLDVNRDKLELTNSSSVGAFSIANTSESEQDSSLQWRVSANSKLVSFEPEAGSLMKGQIKGVRVTVDNRSFREDELFKAVITVRSNAGNHRIDLSYKMEVDGLLGCGTPVTKTRTQEQMRETASAPYAPGELLVGYHASNPSSPLFLQSQVQQELAQLESAVATDFGLTILKRANTGRPALVALPPGETVLDGVRRLSQDPRVAYAEPNYYLQPLELNDPRFGEQWSLQEFGLPQAWDIAIGTTPIVIAILDNGFDTEHEDLKDKMLPGCDFFNNDNDPQAGTNNNGHGTHVSGIAAAIGNNAKGVVGVAYGPGIKLLPVKVLPDVGNGTVSRLLDAMLWAAGLEGSGAASNPNPADIISISLGIAPEDLEGNLPQSVEATAKQVHETGVFILAASGNSSRSDAIFSPANSPWVSAVGSVDADYRRSSFSNYAETGPTVDFVAPGGVQEGQGILSTSRNDSYSYLAGTSMSTPFVAGAAALLLSQAPGLSPGQLKEKLKTSALFDKTYMDEKAYGAGIICVDRALGAATQCGRP